MQVAFIGLDWHQKTGSSGFLTDLLEQHATVERWHGEPGQGSQWGWRADFDESRYDAIVIFQLHEAFGLLSGLHPNVTFVPMYNSMLWAGNLYWKPSFDQAKIACFSWTLRREVMRHGGVHALFQYFPDPSRHEIIDDFSTLRGFLWYRRRDIPPAAAFELCASHDFQRFVVHDAPDPGHAMTDPLIAPPNARRFDRTRWSADGAAYASALRETNVYFAPRPFEGIGMSVLEAMASGHCVVAPDAPTMNEYISNGTNGLLYDPRRREPLDFSAARSLGRRARESVERGHQRWLTSIPALLDFIATPTAISRARTGSFVPVRNRFAAETAPAAPGGRLVSVITCCRDAGGVLEDTMRSVLGQIGCEVEYIVLDLGSSDGTGDIIRRHADQLAAWRRLDTDDGVTARNTALALARGAWLLFLNAGESFASEDALRRMFAAVPPDAGIVHGHHIVRSESGVEELRRTAEFETTWTRLRRGDVGFDWLTGIPARPATAIRRDLLRQPDPDGGFRDVRGIDLLFRARSRDARFYNCDEVVAVTRIDRLASPPDEKDRAELARLALAHAGTEAADRLRVLFASLDGATRTESRLARLARLALRVIAVLDRRSPALACAFERLVRGTPARYLAGWLRRPTVMPDSPTPKTNRMAEIDQTRRRALPASAITTAKEHESGEAGNAAGSGCPHSTTAPATIPARQAVT